MDVAVDVALVFSLVITVGVSRNVGVHIDMYVSGER